ncbi:2-oxoglutarate dehydrogenase E1 component [Alteribacter aurantiacus]|uniref:2-oxoglutarate dehydrogenase E1 component n=1 Tax=Alteribacter aurantiacus TaxID=254410 RepID=UPI000402439D|nr:2-oxoglutarate dehydrogenase E1 component [Alteribacter aurantiacus]
MSSKYVQLDEGWSQFHGPNLGYLLEMYELYKEDADSVDEELTLFFEKWGGPPETENTPTQSGTGGDIHAAIKAAKLTDHIRRNGHLMADISPVEKRETKNLFDLKNYHLTEEALRAIPAHLLTPHAPKSVENGLDAVNHLKKVYSSALAFEFNQVHDLEEREWLYKMVESEEYRPTFTEDMRKDLLKRLNHVEGFEHFLHKTFVGQKRFSIEGLDSMVPMLDDAVKESVTDGAKNVMIGMAHRGRLNVLAHVLGKPYEIIFSEFVDAPNKELVPSEGSVGINYGWTGDVKYHLGADREVEEQEEKATVSLANNPSHLEFVDPVVEGFARAAQDDRSEPGYPKQDKSKAMAILVHGDAAFPGQGIVAETLNLSQLTGYATGGTIHVIANNKIGFTTSSHDSRSTNYASDLAKGFEVPVIHVNADHPEACVAAMHLAYEYRKRFEKDVLIDLIGYRRYGHNEMDEPAATQPQMYKEIRKHKTAYELYAERLHEKGIIESEDGKKMRQELLDDLQSQYEAIKANKRDRAGEMNPPEKVVQSLDNIDTKVDLKTLKQINEELLKFPEGFNVFPKLKKILQRRETALDGDGAVDWALAETLAFATILHDGNPIRLTGQDSERGTFSQRHIVLTDSETNEKYSPLHTMHHANASFAVYNSPLSEAAVVGFDYGYSVQAPETLTIWEAQYGDFSNGAQVIFDQFVSAGRAKWGQKSGLVLLLPHGYEGQGPEHSSGRVERFLQLAAENNWHVTNVTSAAQYFHLLRRQASILGKDEVRPLVVMTPKSLLRHSKVISTSEEVANGKFHSILEQPGLARNPENVKRIVFATGKLTIDLAEAAEELEDKDTVHVVRVEEIYPFPREAVAELKEKYPNAKEWVWAQEEPSNMGAWHYVFPHLKHLAEGHAEVKYIGRRRRSAPAEGDPKAHKQDQKKIVEDALSLNSEGREEE